MAPFKRMSTVLGTRRQLSEFEKICVREDITFTQAPKDGSKINGIVERFHRTVGEMANAFLYHDRMSHIFWEFVYRYSNWLYNRIVHSALVKHSPYEIVYAKRPKVVADWISSSTEVAANGIGLGKVSIDLKKRINGLN